jgi:flagellar motor switch protein FliN
MNALDQIVNFANMQVELEVELDRRIMTVEEILSLDIGSVVKLTRSAGENVDILIAGTLVGFGEIVVIEDSMGIRVTDFFSED